MTKSLTLFAAAAALTAAIGLPALSAIAPPAPDATATILSVTEPAVPAAMTVADSDSDNARAGTHDDDDNDEDDCEEDGGSCGAANNPAPAGTVAPPQNGLFGTGTAPQVQVN